MNDTQSTLLTMYEDIRKILEANGITFYIHFGTAIGALRHNGFIPWMMTSTLQYGKRTSTR